MKALAGISLQLLLYLNAAAAARILAFLPMPWRSHQNVFRPLIRTLALKGHHVDFYTPMPMKDPPKTLRQHVVTDWHDEAMALIDVTEWETFTHFDLQNRMTDVCIYILEKTFTNDQVSIDLLKSNETYDAVISEFPVFVEATAYLAHKFKTINIAVLGFFDNPWLNELSGLPDNPSYMVSYANGFSDKMNFKERLYNFYSTAAIVLSAMWTTTTKQQEWADKRLRYDGWESRPKLMKMISESTALVLVNSHISSGHPYPKAPHVKEISGTHIDPEPLPKHLQDFMDDAPHGVIYFSLGSILDPAEVLSDGKYEILLKVFKSLKQKVMWKIGGLPPTNDPNILVQKWFPQQGILFHKNIKLFITHGGLQSTVEAISAGVPCLGMPYLFDQQKDVAFMVTNGMALQLDFKNITETNLRWSINEIINNPKYLEGAKKRQSLFWDRPKPAAEEAVYWIEYVIRHGPILRPASATMPFYQLYLLDVAAFIVACVILALWILKKTLKMILSLVCSSPKPEVPSSKKTK